MGIQIEFNPDLALRESGTKGRLEEECIPERMILYSSHKFLKKGQRNYYLEGEIPLMITEGNGKLSRPIASIRILEATHFLFNGEPYTRGVYEIIDLFSPNTDKINFESYKRIR
jgi:hypothetical protein